MRIIGIDPGSEVSGVAVLEDGKIIYAANLANTDVLSQIQTLCEHPEVYLAVEQLAAYRGRLSPATLLTAQWIGELIYRARVELFIEPILEFRSSIKRWLFDTCPEVAIPRLKTRMLAIDRRNVAKGKKGLRRADGEMRLPSFSFIDDQIVMGLVAAILKMPKRIPFQKNIYGLSAHSYSAAALALFVRHKLQAANETDSDSQKADRQATTPDHNKKQNKLFE